MISQEIDCENCPPAACCSVQFITMSLTVLEKAHMEAGGKTFQPVVEPQDHDQPDARYPIGAQIHPERRTIQFVYNKENMTEPLPAGFGRYMLIGGCKWLRETPEGRKICGAYEDRPKVCQDFEMGGEKCQILRESVGLTITKKPSN